jgi:hypothetical protein
MTNKQLILEEIGKIPEVNLPEILKLIRSFRENLKASESQYKPIWEVADEIINDIPDNIINQLSCYAAKFNKQHYLYF